MVAMRPRLVTTQRPRRWPTLSLVRNEELSRPTVICSWCSRMLEQGDGRISHGLCDACMPSLLETEMKR
jgi:hypothetical protein